MKQLPSHRLNFQYDDSLVFLCQQILNIAQSLDSLVFYIPHGTRLMSLKSELMPQCCHPITLALNKPVLKFCSHDRHLKSESICQSTVILVRMW